MILIQLISNGLKFSEDKQSVTINLVLEQNQLCIVVLDKGCGIKEQEKLKFSAHFIKVNTVKMLRCKAVDWV
ncbi:ATP-binding protein [Pseudoalteromonas sp. B193]